MGAGFLPEVRCSLFCLLLSIAPRLLEPALSGHPASDSKLGLLPVILGVFTVMLKNITTAPKTTTAKVEVSFLLCVLLVTKSIFLSYFSPICTGWGENQRSI